MGSTQNKDADRLILQTIDSDRDLLETCNLNSYFNNLCNNDFFRNRMFKKYHFLIQDKPEELSWKDYYLKSVYYIDKMKREYGFDFTSKSSGDPKVYYYFLSGRKGNGIKMNFASERDMLHYGIMVSENRGFKDLQEYFEDNLHE
jgi:hypothetical protein